MSHSPLFQHCLRLLGQSTPRSNASPLAHPPRLNRRRFIRSTALMGGTAIVARSLHSLYPAQAQSSGSTPTIAIVRAGLAGLNAALIRQTAGAIADLPAAANDQFLRTA